MRIKYLILCSAVVLALLSSCKTADESSNGTIQVHFSAQDGIEWVIEREIDGAQKKIDAAIYTFTSRPLSQALVDAHKRGVDVRLVLDPTSASGDYGKATYLANHGIDVRIEKGAGRMHHKFALIDDSVVITGSFNWTASAESQNDENILLVKGFEKVYRAYTKEFKRLWQTSKPWVSEPTEVAQLSAKNIRELRNHVGEKVTVTGLVVRVGYSEQSNTYFLDFSDDKGDFTIVIFSRVADKFERSGINIFAYDGVHVKVSGELIDHPQYGLEIILEDPKQLKVVD